MFSSKKQHTAAVLTLRMHEFLPYLPTLNHDLPDPPSGLDEIDAWVWMMKHLSSDLKTPVSFRNTLHSILGEIDDFRSEQRD